MPYFNTGTKVPPIGMRVGALVPDARTPTGYACEILSHDGTGWGDELEGYMLEGPLVWWHLPDTQRQRKTDAFQLAMAWLKRAAERRHRGRDGRWW